MSNGFVSNGIVLQYYCKKKMFQQCVLVKYIYTFLKLLYTVKYLQANIFFRPHKQYIINIDMYFVLLLSVNEKNIIMLHCCIYKYTTIPVFLAQSKNSYKIYYVFFVSFQYHRC